MYCFASILRFSLLPVFLHLYRCWCHVVWSHRTRIPSLWSLHHCPRCAPTHFRCVYSKFGLVVGTICNSICKESMTWDITQRVKGFHYRRVGKQSVWAIQATARGTELQLTWPSESLPNRNVHPRPAWAALVISLGCFTDPRKFWNILDQMYKTLCNVRILSFSTFVKKWGNAKAKTLARSASRSLTVGIL